MLILIAAGGTGGHVYPGIAVAEAIRTLRPEAELRYVGSVGLERELVKESGLRFDGYHEVRGGPLVGVGVLRAFVSAINLMIGTAQSLALIARHKPQALLLTGGWGSLPVTLAAWMLRVPIMIYLPDMQPGQMIRMAQRFASKVAITVPEAGAPFRPGLTVVTGYPLRQQVRAATREAAVAHFGLDPARKTLLVFGGSRGARSINTALLDIAPDVLKDGVQIIHVTGTLDWEQVKARRKSLTDAAGYHAFPYLHDDMGLALAAADVVVSRAGASVLGEFPYFHLPSILVPYPYAGQHQDLNAQYLAERGAAVTIQDSDMARDLLPTLRGILNDPARLAQMQASAARLAVPDGAARAAQELLRLAGAIS